MRGFDSRLSDLQLTITPPSQHVRSQLVPPCVFFLSESEFVNVYGAHRTRLHLFVVPAHQAIHRLAELIPWLLKRLWIRALEIICMHVHFCPHTGVLRVSFWELGSLQIRPLTVFFVSTGLKIFPVIFWILIYCQISIVYDFGQSCCLNFTGKEKTNLRLYTMLFLTVCFKHNVNANRSWIKIKELTISLLLFRIQKFNNTRKIAIMLLQLMESLKTLKLKNAKAHLRIVFWIQMLGHRVSYPICSIILSIVVRGLINLN